MIRALVYLQLTSLKNALRSRFLRLRNPRYFFAALVGAAYFYFIIFRNGTPSSPPVHEGHALPVGPMPAADWLEPVAALVLFIVVALTWILPNSRAALAFTEAEVAFLFPAPVSRKTLVHFKLIKSQLSILFSMAILTLISNRWTYLGGSAWTHAAGWWLIFSIYNLHLIGASFARERLLDFGINATRRRIIVCGCLVLLGAVTWFMLGRTVMLPSESDVQNVSSLMKYFETVLSSPPMSWVLLPFRWVVKPFLAADFGGLLAAFWPGLLLLAAHYVWVLRSDVAFEEASVALSQKRAERVTAMRAGHWPARAPTKKRREPFALASTGFPSTAFLWKSLIAAGPAYYPKYWFMAGGVLVGGVYWLLRDPSYGPVAKAVGIFLCVISVYGLLFGPVIARRGLALMLERIDLLKGYPLRGWQVVLGELMCPVVILCTFEWVVLGLLGAVLLLSAQGDKVAPVLLGTGLVSAGLLVMPLAALLFALNYAGALYFPAWLSASTQHGAGIEKVGQRLIFFVGYLVVLVVALLPSLLFGAIPYILIQWIWHKLALAIGLGSVTVFVVLLGELALVIWWLGRRFERFDLSAELPRP
jgi:hypothetical protein